MKPSLVSPLYRKKETSISLHSFYNLYMRNCRLTWLLALTMTIAGSSALSQQNAVTPDMRARIEAQAASTLQKSGNPSAVVALVQHGQVVYTGAFGDARVKPE